jgi:3-hydroxybutyryl-CoA dehydrogenase
MSTGVIHKIAKIGTGVMGTNVAWACAVNGLETYLYDQSETQLKGAVEKLKSWFFDGSLPEKRAEAALNRIHPCSSLEQALADVDLAFESVYEDLEVKKTIHAEIGRLAAPAILQGSNASSLLCSPMAEASGRPEKFFNMNFTDPHSGEELVEVMWNPKTTESTKKAAIGWARALKMVPIVTQKEIMGYAFNRIWRAVKKEALNLANLQAADPHDIDRAWMLIFGTPYGPFGLMDRIGLDTVKKIELTYFNASGDENDKPPEILTKLVESGHKGEKAGKGFYEWPNPAFQQPGWLRKEPPWDSDDT